MTAVCVYNAALIFGTGGFAVFNVIALALIVSAVIALGAAIIWAITSNLRQGEAYRQKLGERFARLRLGAALERFGLEPARYLHTQPIVSIEDQMRKCSTCEETARCDDTLAKPTSRGEDFRFCPNYPELQKAAASFRSERRAEQV
jgi:hypothetical protein